MPVGKCKLCLQTKDLQKSHLMPASLYKKTRNVGAQNPNPTLITKKGEVQTSRQIRDHLLCKECEQLFSKNGENYVMCQVAEAGRGRKFPLLSALQSSKPTKTAAGFNWYDWAAVPSIDREKLGYFALSVFWRASVHLWKEPGLNAELIDLGPYEEALRKYLLGQTGFPADVVLLTIVCTDPGAQDMFYVPSQGRREKDRTHTFQARGINFMMIVGKQLPNTMRTLCTATGADKWLLSRDCQDKMAEALMRVKSR